MINKYNAIKMNELKQKALRKIPGYDDRTPIVLIIDPLTSIANPVYQLDLNQTFIEEYRERNFERGN